MRTRGAVFVITLAILATVVAIVASVAVSEKIAIDVEENRLDQIRAKQAAMAGIQRAIETLNDASASGTTTNVTGGANSGSGVNSPGASTLQDDWATLGTTGNDRFLLGDSSFRLQILDACSLMNLNTATQQQLTNLPLLTEQVDAILDWRTAGENARSDGAKDDYYSGLANPYQATLNNFSSISELLDVRYFTPADLYDAPTNQPAVPLPNFPDGRTPTLSDLITVDSVGAAVNQQGNTLPSLTSASQAQLARLGPFGTQLYSALHPRAGNRTTTSTITTWAALIRAVPTISTANLTTLLNTYSLGTSQTGKINLNTASAAVLQTIPNLTQDIAQSIVNQQSTGITQMGSILTIPGLSTARTAANFLDYFTIKSQSFIVRVTGTAGNASESIEAVISVTSPAGQNSTSKIVRMEEQPFNDMTGRWGWQTTTNNDINLLESQ